jgi:hypothetical protein
MTACWKPQSTPTTVDIFVVNFFYKWLLLLLVGISYLVFLLDVQQQYRTAVYWVIRHEQWIARKTIEVVQTNGPNRDRFLLYRYPVQNCIRRRSMYGTRRNLRRNPTSLLDSILRSPSKNHKIDGFHAEGKIDCHWFFLGTGIKCYW